MASRVETLTLRECAERLGVHYMTAYRYVRLGMLPAHKVGSEWHVTIEDLEHFRESGTSNGRGRNHRSAPWADRLTSRMVAGDERGAWQVVEAALSSGMEPTEIYTDVLGPAMRSVGDRWADGSASIAEEHLATAVATRIVGRMSARFTHRGRPRGRVVIGTPPGEAHGLPAAMVADMLRGAGFEVVDLGHDLPVEAFVEAVVGAAPVTAIAISIITSGALPVAERLIGALRDATDTPIVVGGGADSGPEHAARLGADAYAADGPAAVGYALALTGH
jgi:excisionase family DNA binding protein